MSEDSNHHGGMSMEQEALEWSILNKPELLLATLAGEAPLPADMMASMAPMANMSQIRRYTNNMNLGGNRRSAIMPVSGSYTAELAQLMQNELLGLNRNEEDIHNQAGFSSGNLSLQTLSQMHSRQLQGKTNDYGLLSRETDMLKEKMYDGMTSEEIQEVKTWAQSRSHSEAERRRRERINKHLSTLRDMLPSTPKPDKATLLAEVVNRVKQLDQRLEDLSKLAPVPNDVEEVTAVKICSQGTEEQRNQRVKVSLCCDDRPDLLTSVIKTLQVLNLHVFRLDTSTLGSRVKHVLVLGLLTSQEDSAVGAINTFPTTGVILEAFKKVVDPYRSRHLDRVPSSSGYLGKRMRFSKFESSSSQSED